MITFDSDVARQFVQAVVSGNQQRATGLARSTLGGDVSTDRQILRTRLFDAMENLRSYLYFPPATGGLARAIRTSLAMATGKAGFLTRDLREVFPGKREKSVSLVKAHEIDIWLNGLNEFNQSISLVPYRRGITEPGFAAD